MSQVLLTGATGFIGQCMLRHLQEGNYHVRVLIRNKMDTFKFTKQEVFVGDLTQPDSLFTACENIDTVFHLAGFAHAFSHESESLIKQHDTVNLQGTRYLMDEAHRAGVKRFVFFSSVKAVGKSQDKVDESFIEAPDSPYGKAKREAENIVLSAQDQGMHVCILRPSLVYGPGLKGNLYHMMRAIDKGLFLPLPEVNNRRSLVSTEDICRAALLGAYHPKAQGKIYFVTDGVPYSTQRIYHLICQALGKKIPRWFIPVSFFKCLAYMGDVSKKISGRRLFFDSEMLTKLFDSAYFCDARIQHDLAFHPIDDLEKMLPSIVKTYRTLG